jgi:Uma2 family endonuclease
MNRTARRFTAGDYRGMSEGPPWFQLIDGELINDPAPNVPHQIVSRDLLNLLTTHALSFDLGVVLAAPTDVWLSNDNVFQPDILFVSKARQSLVANDGVHGAPELVIEIISPHSVRRDSVRKLTIYARAGVVEYWLVDPAARQITIYEFTRQCDREPKQIASGRDWIRSPLFPGLEIRVDSFFVNLKSIGG